MRSNDGAISPFVSKKIARLSLVFCIFVIAHHSYVGAGTLWQLLFDGVLNTAVPFFFLVSGLLMFRRYDCSASWVKSIYFSRFKTLFIPYCFWAVFGLLLFGVFCFMGVCDRPKSFDLRWWLSAMGISGAPISMRYLWFVRRLLIFVFFAPVIGFLSSRGTFLLIPLGAFFSFVIWGRSADVWRSLLFFSMGASLALKTSILTSDKSEKCCYIFTSAFCLFLISSFFEYSSLFGFERVDCVMIQRSIHLIFVTSVIVTICFGYDLVASKVNGPARYVDGWTGGTFFVYCVHGPIWLILRKLHVPINLFTCWPIILAIIFLSFGLYWYLKNRHPFFYRCISGGRGG